MTKMGNSGIEGSVKQYVSKEFIETSSAGGVRKRAGGVNDLAGGLNQISRGVSAFQKILEIPKETV